MPRLAGTSQRIWQGATLALLAAYFIAGVFGRFPWKADEPYYFGVTWHMMQSGDWLVPRLAGQPFMEKPPLVYWLGAGFAHLVPAWPAHEAARIAVLLLVLVSVAAVYACARLLVRELAFCPLGNHGPVEDTPGRGSAGYATAAILLIPGCLGFTEHIHKLTADVAQMAGAMVALLGLIMLSSIGTASRERAGGVAIVSGLLVGTGTGVAFLAKGLLVPCILACTSIGCLAIPSFRTRHGLMAALAGTLALAPWIVLWPSELFSAAPDLFHEWFFTHNLGRFIGDTRLGGNVSLVNKVKTLVIAGGPILVLCAAMVVYFRRRAASLTAALAPGHRCVAIYVGSCLLVLGTSAVLRDNYLLPLLPGLVLFGLPALYVYPSATRAKRLLDIAFGACAAIVLMIWLGLVTTGEPLVSDWLAEHLGRVLPLPFGLAPDFVALAIAVLAVSAWWLSTRHEGLRSVTLAWCTGIAMLWVVGNALLLPWIDAARSYDALFTELKSRVHDRQSCIATVNLGESELAMFHYVTGVEPVRAHRGISGGGDPDRPNPAAELCDGLLVLSNPYSGPIEPCTQRWILEWSGTRPGDRREHFALYRSARVERAVHDRRRSHGSNAAEVSSPFASMGAAACVKDVR